MQRVIVIILCLVSSFVHAQDDHLVPTIGVFSNTSSSMIDKYHFAVTQSLTSGVERSSGDGNLRIVVTPSFQKQWLLQINFFNHDDIVTCPIIVLSVPERTILPGDFSLIVKNKLIKKCIDKNLADEVSQLIKLILKETHYSQNVPSGLDGTTYYFSSFVDDLGIVNGSTWSPPSDSKMGSLVRLANALKKYALSKKNDTNDIKKALEALRGRLK